ncbi:LuxR family transcriptional regulator [Oricola thermophila]|uniref:LuxR family transcriptional regulator n=1 Tax=Oricola thermophila TaxID=2742145 RepID=A0A6N1VJ76_9HYPH|nr:LuxR family transcriptional regulator [Oricola thermophila]QKV19279.1 LuxR family transcriptional regulator [Oricola thermophila]
MAEDNDLLEAAYGIVNSSDDVQEIVNRIRDLYGLHHCVFHLGQTKLDALDRPYVKTTYSDAWISRYLLKGYINVDPIAREGFLRMLPFDWRELEIDESAAEMMIDAANHDIGASGYSIPVIDRSSRRSLFSVTSKLTGPDWDEFIKARSGDLQEIAFRIHRKALAEVESSTDPMPPLGPREIECLQWTARGKDYLAIAEILGLSGHTVRGYLKSARFKLECATLPQAVAKAISLKIISG